MNARFVQQGCLMFSAWGGRVRAAARVWLGVAACLLGGLLTAAPAPAAAPAAPTTTYLPADGSKLVIDGTSTLHDWSAKSTVMQGSVKTTGSFTAGGAPGIAAIKLVLPVVDLKSSEGSGMDSTMYDALHKDRHPAIRYTLTTATLKTSPTAAGGAYTFDTTGTLRVNGVNKVVPLTLRVTVLSNGGLQLAVKTALKMTDYKVDPPTAMLGIIRSGNTITVHATWNLAPVKVKAKP